MDIRSVFAARLKALREKEGLSQTELGDQIGISRGSISFYEKGDRTADIDVLCRVAKRFGVSTDYLLGISDSAKIEEYFDELNGRKIEINNLALDLYSKINECFFDFHVFYYNKFGLENDGDSDPIVPNMTKLIYTHMKYEIEEVYNRLYENLVDGSSGKAAISEYLEYAQSDHIFHEIVEEIFKLTE